MASTTLGNATECSRSNKLTIYALCFISFYIIMMLRGINQATRSSYVQSQVLRSSYCSQQPQDDTNPIHDICSFAHYLGLHSWTPRMCTFKAPQDYYPPLNRWLSNLWNRKLVQCDTINVHQHLMKQEEKSVVQEDQFTILINTWRRDECLIDSVKHYLECPAVAQIRVIWSDPINPVPERLMKIRNNVGSDRLEFDEYRDDKLTNRFKWNDEWRTEGIFQTDDDIKYSCDLIANAFKLWKMTPHHLVGFAPRIPANDYRVKGQLNGNKLFYLWSGAYRQCRYEMMFQTMGGFIHRKYYALYTEDGIDGEGTGWRRIKQFVDGNVTAEDITLSLLYSFYSRDAPIAVVVPESEFFIKEYKQCSRAKSTEMHSNADTKRTKIFLDTLDVLGFYDKVRGFNDVVSSTLFVDVMPVSDQLCWGK